MATVTVMSCGILLYNAETPTALLT